MKLAVVGAGWAGLAAAVRATEAGHRVKVFEMAAQPGGRARGVLVDEHELDNGQHILIGAYRRTLALLECVGVAEQDVLYRQPMQLHYPDGRGLSLPEGPSWLAFGRAVWTCRGWTASDRRALTVAALGWAAQGFRCADDLTVDGLCHALPPAVRELLIDPLCVAALNTPAPQASAAVMLRVLRDAVFGGAGAADLLLPRKPLTALLPQPATAWLGQRGANLRLRHRVQSLERDGALWRVDGEPFDGVVLACSAAEAARLTQPLAPTWSALAGSLPQEPIVTVYLHCPGARLPAAMVALLDGPNAPAQFAFDHGAIGAADGVFAFVISGAREWVERGLEAAAKAVLAQAGTAFRAGTWPRPPRMLHVAAEKRATFACTPGLRRPAPGILPGLHAAGDYVEGPYPATLEGAVRAGERAARLAGSPFPG